MLKYLTYMAFGFTFYTLGVISSDYVRESLAHFYFNYSTYVGLIMLGFLSGVGTMYFEAKRKGASP